jgi:hypothetical protein
MTRLLLTLVTGPVLLATSASAQSGWKQHDMNRPRPPVMAPAEQMLPVQAPPDAIVLFDGSDLEAWEAVDGSPTRWQMSDGAMVPVRGAGDIRTKQAFGDVQLHVEWATPTAVRGGGQARGNSGVFLMGLYEVQVLDSYDNVTYADGQAASIYGQFPPLVNVSRPPGEWQTYDIYFRVPRFDANGMLLEPARMTVHHNGVLVHNNVEPVGPTMWLQSLPYEAHAEKLPLSLQDHGDPVRFRNIWVRELPQHVPGPPAGAYAEPTVTLTIDQLDRLTGRYGRWTVYRQSTRLLMHFTGPQFIELIPHSPRRFSLAHTAGSVVFELDEEGVAQRVIFRYAGEEIPAARRE